MPADVAEFFAAAAAGDARAHAAIDWLRGNKAEPRQAMPGAGGAGGGMSDADLEARNNDPRNNPGSPTYSPAFRAGDGRDVQEALRIRSNHVRQFGNCHPRVPPPDRRWCLSQRLITTWPHHCGGCAYM